MSNSFYHERYCLTEKFPDSIQRNLMDTLELRGEICRPISRISTFCKVHQHAAGARKKYGNQAMGVSRGGKSTKIHALVTENFQLIGLLLTSGNILDSQCATELLSKVNLEEKLFLATKLFVRLIFGILSKRKAALFVFPTKPTRVHYIISTKNSTKLATLLNAFSCG